MPSDSHHAPGAIVAAPLLSGPDPVWTRNRIAALILAYVVGLGGMILIKGV